jgi:hypothetical protein
MTGSLVKPFARTARMGLDVTAYEPNKQNVPKTRGWQKSNSGISVISTSANPDFGTQRERCYGSLQTNLNFLAQ